ncbi:hypothetical protein VBD025_13655 [Virgibacillus flavescens]|uniref:hypothetical protein n=1 Tax=Virgibacillus flavescens TaxID=1611422 RepID=UPI003D3299A8
MARKIWCTNVNVIVMNSIMILENKWEIKDLFFGELFNGFIGAVVTDSENNQ